MAINPMSLVYLFEDSMPGYLNDNAYLLPTKRAAIGALLDEKMRAQDSGLMPNEEGYLVFAGNARRDLCYSYHPRGASDYYIDRVMSVTPMMIGALAQDANMELSDYSNIGEFCEAYNERIAL